MVVSPTIETVLLTVRVEGRTEELRAIVSVLGDGSRACVVSVMQTVFWSDSMVAVMVT